MLKEHDECVMLAKILKSKNVMFAKIPSEIRTPSIKQKMFQKAEWMTSGLPDYLISIRKSNWKKQLMFIEMKKKKWWVVSPSQKLWIKELTECWIPAKVCNWTIEAINFINNIIQEDD